MELKDYRFGRQIYASATTQVFRAQRVEDGRAVVLKKAAQPYPDAGVLARYRHECDILTHLNGRGAVKTLGIGEHQTAPVLVLEDLNLSTLDAWMASNRTLREILEAARALTAAVAAIHGSGVIHRDINPQNALIDPGTRWVTLIDFGTATRFVQEQQARVDLDALEGTLAYLAPEQTGRTHRLVDERADLYAVGATLYALFTGAPPFSGETPMEMVHAHLARVPDALQSKSVRPIPPVISDIVLRLLAKNPDDRYQSARGLEEDLGRCLDLLTDRGSIRPFPLGARDLSARLRIPRRLYGREAELSAIQEARGRVEQGTAEWVMVTGGEGSGKTALMDEAFERLRSGSGLVGRATLRPEHANMPYTALFQALNDALGMVVELSDQAVKDWRDRLSRTLGRHADILVSHIAHLQDLTPQASPVPVRSWNEARVALEAALASLCSVLCRPGSPVTLLLDNMQWTDRDTLEMLRYLFDEGMAHHFFLVGTAIPTLMSPELVETVDDIRTLTPALTECVLQPLTCDDIHELLSNALVATGAELRGLAEVLAQKTQGNPFFIHQMLSAWTQQRVLTVDPERNRWVWDIQAIRNTPSSDNVGSFLVDRIHSLDDATRKMLGLASCIDEEFDEPLLTHLLSASTPETVALLHRAIELTLIEALRRSGTGTGGRQADLTASASILGAATRFRFAHPRVREAAAQQLPQSEAARAHLQIVRWMKASGDAAQLRDSFETIAAHWNQVVGHLSPEDTWEAIRDNLAAGHHAEEAGRLLDALSYYEAGVSILPPDAWDVDNATTTQLYMGLMQMMRVVNRPQESMELARLIAERAHQVSDRLTAVGWRLNVLTAHGDLAEAVVDGIEALAWADIPVDRRVSRRQALALYERVRAAVEAKTRDELIEFPENRDPTLAAAMRTIMVISNAAGSDRVWYGYLSLLRLELSLEQGYTPPTGSAFMAMPAILGITERDALERIVDWAEIGYAASQRFGTGPRLNAAVTMGTTINHWKNPLRTSLDYLAEFEQLCMGIGMWDHISLHAAAPVLIKIASGFELDAVRQESKRLYERAEELSVDLAQQMLEPVIQALDVLRGHDGVVIETPEDVNIILDSDVPLLLSYVKTLVSLILGRPEDGIAPGEEAFRRMHIRADIVDFLTPEVLFNYALCMTRVWPRVDADTKDRFTRHLSRIRRLFTVWAEASPANYQHKHALIEAEYRSLKRRPWHRVMPLYDEAIEGAAKQGFLHIQALANEFHGRYWARQGKERLARLYLTEARYLYGQWGSAAKVRDLGEKYPQWLPPEDLRGAISAGAAAPAWDKSTPGASETGSRTGDAVDLSTVLRMSQAISGEVRSDRLLSQLLSLSMENAGAERGCLILAHQSGWAVEAFSDARGQRQVLKSLPLQEFGDVVPLGIIQYAIRTGSAIVLDNACEEGRFVRDLFVRKHHLRSVLCLPVIRQGRTEGALYLENNLTAGAFTPDRVEVLRMLSGQAAISMINARLYETMDREIQERTEALRRTQQQMVEAEKMASLGQLTAGVAHEINNPINFVASSVPSLKRDVEDLLEAVSGYDSLLREGGMAEQAAAIRERFDLDYTVQEVSDLLRSIEEGARRTAAIVGELRTFSRADENELQVTDVRAGIESTLTLLRGRYEPNIRVVRHYDEHIPEIEGYPGKLNQVWMNLLANAVQAIPDTGEIHIWVESDADQVHVRIHDTGHGMPDEVRRHIFEPFFTTKEVGSGTGLGLSITYGIVTDHHGSIAVDSQPGRGTTFSISLPLHQR